MHLCPLRSDKAKSSSSIGTCNSKSQTQMQGARGYRGEYYSLLRVPHLTISPQCPNATRLLRAGESVYMRKHISFTHLFVSYSDAIIFYSVGSGCIEVTLLLPTFAIRRTDTVCQRSAPHGSQLLLRVATRMRPHDVLPYDICESETSSNKHARSISSSRLSHWLIRSYALLLHQHLMIYHRYLPRSRISPSSAGHTMRSC